MNVSLYSTARKAAAWAAIVIACAAITAAKSKDDVVILKNGDRMTGEIKKLQRGELIFKADYMAESVRLDWSQVASLVSKDNYQILMTDGQIFTDVLNLTGPSTDSFSIGPAGVIKVNPMNVLRILPIETSFWRQLEGSIDVGLSFTSGNENYQTNVSGLVNYRRGKDGYTARIDSALSGQSEGDRNARNQFTFDYRRQVSPKWYVGGMFDALRSDQQDLALRLTGGGLVGRNLVQTERTRLSTFAGLAVSREKYNVLPARDWSTNTDVIGGLDFQTFRFSAADVTTRFMAFPSVTTPGRVRLQLQSDLRIKLASDLWWGFHLYENYDSKPPNLAEKNDLGISASIGWKF